MRNYQKNYYKTVWTKIENLKVLNYMLYQSMMTDT